MILGKTNLSEWANFRSTHSTSGWSGRGGQTRNPYALDRNPCGSSSGTGAAIAANLAAVGVGTETDGSVVCPSSACGLVGIKPTLGLVSRTGIIPIAHSQDTAGPMARTVTDAAILLGAMTGVDSLDAITAESRAHEQTDYTKFLDANALRGARIGVARKYFGFNDQVDRVMKDAIDVIQKLGATIVDPADIETAGKFDDSEFEVLLYEFKADLNAYLAALAPNVKVRSLADLIRFNEEHRDREMPYFGQEILERAEKKGPLSSDEYKKALAKNHLLSRKQGIDATIAETQARRADRADRRTGLADRSRQRRSLHRRLFDRVRGRRLSAHHGAGRIRARAARRPLVLRRRLERAEAPRLRVRVRTGDEGEEGSEVPSDDYGLASAGAAVGAADGGAAAVPSFEGAARRDDVHSQSRARSAAESFARGWRGV